MNFENTSNPNNGLPHEFSINEQQNDLTNSLNSLNHFPSFPKTPSPTKVITDIDYGKKYMFAILYLENTLLRAKIRKANQEISLSKMKETANICVSNLRYQEMSKTLIFKSQKCLDLEIELSKLKNKMEKMRKYGMNKREENKENDQLNSNRGRGTPNKTTLKRKNSGLKRGEKKTVRGRSKSRNKTPEKGKSQGINSEIGQRFNVNKFKEKYKETEKKALTFLQLLDNSRHELIKNMEGLEKIERNNPDSLENNKVLRSQKSILLSVALNKWRLSSGFPTLDKETLISEDSLLPLLRNPIGEKLWNLSCLKDRPSSEFQLFRLNKGYLLYERTLLDFKKEVFFKRRFRVLMNSILRETQRKMKIQKIVAFYKLIASSVFIAREDLGIIGGEKYHGIQKPIGIFGEKITDKIISHGGLDRDDSFLVGKSFFLFNRQNEDEIFPMNLLESEEREHAKQKWVENIRNPDIIPNDVELLELQMDRFGMKGTQGKDQIYMDKNITKGKGKKGKSVLKTKHKMMIEEKKKRMVTKIIYKLYLRLIERRRNALLTWYRQSMKSQQSELLEEFENMNIILSERAFREKVFRTKIRLLQNQIAKQIEYFAKLMVEENTFNKEEIKAVNKMKYEQGYR